MRKLSRAHIVYCLRKHDIDGTRLFILNYGLSQIEEARAMGILFDLVGEYVIRTRY